MVDFQSRDTSRGYGNDEKEQETDDEDPEATGETQSAVDDPATESKKEQQTYGPDTVPYAVVTIADDRSTEEDVVGTAVVDAIEHDGGTVSTRELIPAEYDSVQSSVGSLAGRRDVAAIITLGGVGVSPDDVTVGAVEPLFDKRLPGFGELYRVLSHDFDGTAVVRTRTTAGIVDGVPVFCLPDDAAGARRGVEQIVLDEAGAIAEQAREE